MIAESSDKQIKQLESRTHYELQVPTQRLDWKSQTIKANSLTVTYTIVQFFCFVFSNAEVTLLQSLACKLAAGSLDT